MAIRYSGDVEIRLQKGRSGYFGTVRAPQFRLRVIVPQGFLKPQRNEHLAFDHAAILMVKIAEVQTRRVLPLETDARGRIFLRRVFQSACPEE